jgi:hypothetical protein
MNGKRHVCVMSSVFDGVFHVPFAREREIKSRVTCLASMLTSNGLSARKHDTSNAT